MIAEVVCMRRFLTILIHVFEIMALPRIVTLLVLLAKAVLDLPVVVPFFFYSVGLPWTAVDGVNERDHFFVIVQFHQLETTRISDNENLKMLIWVLALTTEFLL